MLLAVFYGWVEILHQAELNEARSLTFAEEKFGLSDADFPLCRSDLHLNSSWVEKRRHRKIYISVFSVCFIYFFAFIWGSGGTGPQHNKATLRVLWAHRAHNVQPKPHLVNETLGWNFYAHWSATSQHEQCFWFWLKAETLITRLYCFYLTFAVGLCCLLSPWAEDFLPAQGPAEGLTHILRALDFYLFVGVLAIVSRELFSFIVKSFNMRLWPVATTYLTT